MGFTSYSTESRSLRSSAMGYHSLTASTMSKVFEQQDKRMIHAEMDPKGVSKRECRDSVAHPNTVPVCFFLDLTGSMGEVPRQMIKDGLPTLMSTLIQNGIPDASLMFAGVGDHECDKFPLQVAQFESGDEELDMWLTRTYLEGGGGGNRGESYLLAWYFAAFHTSTDALEQRGKKGFLFTVGDEPNLSSLPVSAVKQIMGDTAVGQTTYSAEELLAKAQEKFHVYHIHVDHGGRSLDSNWVQVLGDNVKVTKEPTKVAKLISDIILSHEDGGTQDSSQSIRVDTPATESGEPIML